MTAPPHLYVSTGCLHAEHASCRQTCKFCGASCLCPHHMGRPLAQLVSPVDQARNVARFLYDQLLRGNPVDLVSLVDLESNPDNFWLRGEIPSGQWSQPSS